MQFPSCLIGNVRKKLQSSSSRSKNVAINSVVVFVCKALYLLISLALLPLTIGYVNSEKYGIWLTISSISAWLGIFDLGMGKGLKNRYVECISNGDAEKAQRYVSTTYAMLSFIFLPLLLCFYIVNTQLDWSAILNVKVDENLNTIFFIVISYVCLNFIFSVINSVLEAEQRSGEASFRQLIQQLFVLITIYILTKTTEGSLYKLCIVLCFIPLLVCILFNVTLFSTRYKSVRPKLNKVDLSIMSGLFNLGLKFFFLQSVALVLFQLTNFIIIRFYSAEDVTLYNVSYRYFSIPTIFFAALVAPAWAAVTEAKSLGDFQWIRIALNKYGVVLFLFIILEILMLLVCNPIYRLWIGDKIPEIPYTMSLLCMIGGISSMVPLLYVSVLCGAGYLKIQILFSTISPFIFVGLCYLFIIVFHLDVFSVIMASLISNVYGIVIAPIQCYKVFYKNKKGVWIR